MTAPANKDGLPTSVRVKSLADRDAAQRVTIWRAPEGPSREIFFPQRHEPDRLCEPDIMHMSSTGALTLERPTIASLGLPAAAANPRGRAATIGPI